MIVEFEVLKQKLTDIKGEIKELGEGLNIARMQNEVDRLEEKAADPNFWNDIESSQKVLQKTKQLKDKIATYNRLVRGFEDCQTLVEMGIEAEDSDLVLEAQSEFENVNSTLEQMRLETLLTGEYDKNNAIISFHAGAGGTEAQDWVSMLYRMYMRWAERHGYKFKMVDYLDGDEAGIKSAVVEIEGENAFGFLKSEMGVHRLVRISPFDSSGRRHTSFASVEVMPEIDDDIKIDINPDDLKVDTYRSSGAGGQHVNKTESAIRITHIPTGVVVACQNERSQHKNRDTAMKMLKSKLVEIKEREHLDKIEDIKGNQKDIAWGSQIRSYVFMPYTLAKDHRTSFESGNINAVMDGEIDGFINAYLKAASHGALLAATDDME